MLFPITRMDLYTSFYFCSNRCKIDRKKGRHSVMSLGRSLTLNMQYATFRKRLVRLRIINIVFNYSELLSLKMKTRTIII